MDAVPLNLPKDPALAERPSRLQQTYVLGLLLLIYILHHFDRNILLLLQEPIRREFSLSDSQLGALTGIAYALPFALAGVPFGAVADRVARTRMLALLILIWSTFTAVTGFARSFGMLLVTRAAVGAAEAGAPPAILSIVADTYPPQSRPAALSILFMGPLIGLLAGSLVGGAAAAAFGWRGALWIAAAPGMLLALLVMLSLREPLRGRFESTAEREQSAEPMLTVFRFAMRHAPLRATVLGMVSASVVSIGIASWIPVLLMRVHGLPIEKAGPATALAVGLPGGVGSLVAAWIAARYAAGRRGRLLRVCGIAIGVSLPFGLVGALAGPMSLTLPCFALWSFASTMYIGPGHSLYLSLVAPRMRGTLAALVVVLCNLVGAGLGPQIVGTLSDTLRKSGDAQSLVHAVAMLAIAGLIPVWLFFSASRQPMITAAQA